MRFHRDGSLPEEGEAIFVFGSNLAGRHGKGAAHIAKTLFGARYGTAIGRTGAAYAIPTKNAQLVVLPLTEIRPVIRRFLEYARETPSLTFFVTRVGCGLAGYSDEAIAPAFKGAPSNCSFAAEWRPFLED